MALSKRVRLSAENGQLQCYKKMHIHYNNRNVRVKRYGSLTLLVKELGNLKISWGFMYLFIHS